MTLHTRSVSRVSDTARPTAREDTSSRSRGHLYSPAEVAFCLTPAKGAAVAGEAPTPALQRLSDRVESLQARYDATRSHRALYDLQNANTALVAAQNAARRTR